MENPGMPEDQREEGHLMSLNKVILGNQVITSNVTLVLDDYESFIWELSLQIKL